MLDQDYYPKYPQRKIVSLDGTWEFCWLGNDILWNELNPEKLEYTNLMSVPGVFDTVVDYAGQRGVGVYRKKITMPAPAERQKLKIGGLGLLGKIWFNGEFIAEYKIPYSGIEYALPANKYLTGENTLIIAVDNRFDAKNMSLFSPSYDFYGYGGIYRSVEIHQLEALSINRVKVKTVCLKTGSVEIEINLSGAIKKECDFSVSFDGENLQKIKSVVNDKKIKLELKVPNFKIWSPETPNLHTIEVDIGSDKIIERFGIRTVKTKNGKIFLNEKLIKLKGFNRHEAHPEFGPVQTTQSMINDLQWLKKMNCNFVRCVHYPQDQRFLDLCDQFGFLAWEESMGWGNSEFQCSNPEFIELQKIQTSLMVDNSFNHPCLIMWGFMNEGASDSKDAVPLYKELSNILREKDGSRLVTYASNRLRKDICFEFVDVISINIYPGWIDNIAWDCKSIDCITPFIDDLVDFMRRDDLQNKPCIVSEIGVCAFHGNHDMLCNLQWSEEFQAQYMDTAVREILNNSRFSGVAVWQMFDTRSYGTFGQIRTKPNGYNYAGVLDPHRQPKLASETLKTIFGEF
jgi:beta-glucuronidase